MIHLKSKTYRLLIEVTTPAVPIDYHKIERALRYCLGARERGAKPFLMAWTTDRRMVQCRVKLSRNPEQLFRARFERYRQRVALERPRKPRINPGNRSI